MMESIQIYESEFGGPPPPPWMAVRRAIIKHRVRQDTPGYDNRGARKNEVRKFNEALQRVFDSSVVGYVSHDTVAVISGFTPQRKEA